MFNMRPNSLIYGARYDRVMEAFGGKGFFVEDQKNLKGALAEAMNHRGPALVNVVLSQGSAGEPPAVPLAQLICWGQPESVIPRGPDRARMADRVRLMARDRYR